MELYTTYQVEQAITAAVNSSLIIGFIVGFIFYFLAFDFGDVVRNITHYFRQRQKTKSGPEAQPQGVRSTEDPTDDLEQGA